MENTGHILVASSCADRRRECLRALELEGHKTHEARAAAQTIQQSCSGRLHLLLMDATVDGVEAHGLCRAIRPKAKLGIIVLGGEAGPNAIDVLNAGADDYVPAPFVMAEVTARVRALLRRVPTLRSRQIMLEDRAIDLDSHEVRGPNGRVNRLTPKEFLVLEQLAANANQPSTRQHLAQTIWQRDGTGEVEYMRIVIKQLRRKLEPNPEQPQYILTERDVGYRLCLPSSGPRRAVSGCPDFSASC